MSAQGAFAELVRGGGRGALVTLLEGEGAGAKVLVRADGSAEGSLGSPERDARATAAADELMWAERSERRDELFIDVTAPPPRLVAFGAVDFAATLCTVARAAGWRPFVCDPRRAFADPARFPDAEQVVAKWPEEAFAQIGGIDRATAVAVLTHDPKLDDAALLLALASDAGYIGAMGARRAQERRRERLLAHGVEESRLERISAPIGLDLGARSAQETALSVIAEIVALRHGRAGGRLAHATGGIH